VRPLPEDTGERFFSQYWATELQRRSVYPRLAVALCPCYQCQLPLEIEHVEWVPPPVLHETPDAVARMVAHTETARQQKEHETHQMNSREMENRMQTSLVVERNRREQPVNEFSPMPRVSLGPPAQARTHYQPPPLLQPNMLPLALPPSNQVYGNVPLAPSPLVIFPIPMQTFIPTPINKRRKRAPRKPTHSCGCGLYTAWLASEIRSKGGQSPHDPNCS
jgi:hypothetical protein